MPYTLPGTFVDGSTTVPVGAQNLNEIVAAVTDLDTRVTATASTANAAVPKTTGTAKGDLLIASASGVITRVGVGADAQVLTADSTTGTGVKWGAPASGGSGIPASTVTAKADLIVATANATVSRLGVGTDGQVLTAASGQATGLSWVTPASGGGGAVTSVAGRTGAVTLTSTDVGLGNVANSLAVPQSLLAFKGDLISTSGSVVQRIGVGTDTQVLTADSTTTTGMKWATPTSGGGVTSVAGRTGAVVLAAADVSGVLPVAAYNAKGAILSASAASAVSALLPGLTGQVLTVNPAATLGVDWETPSADIPKSTLTTKGDIIAYDGTAAAPARVAVGTDGQVLMASSIGSTRGVVWATFNTVGGSAKITSATGSPNSVLTGSVGDLYLRTDGGAGTTLYVKESGAGTNTGWVGK